METHDETATETEKLLASCTTVKNAILAINQNIAQLEREKAVLQQRLCNFQAQLMHVCPHQWIRQPPQYQEPTWWRCNICQNTR